MIGDVGEGSGWLFIFLSDSKESGEGNRSPFIKSGSKLLAFFKGKSLKSSIVLDSTIWSIFCKNNNKQNLSVKQHLRICKDSVIMEFKNTQIKSWFCCCKQTSQKIFETITRKHVLFHLYIVRKPLLQWMRSSEPESYIGPAQVHSNSKHIWILNIN